MASYMVKLSEFNSEVPNEPRYLIMTFSDMWGHALNIYTESRYWENVKQVECHLSSFRILFT